MGRLALDDEEFIIDFLRSHLNGQQTTLFTGNSLEKRVFRCLKDAKSLISNNSHEALPPDFLSPNHNIMFDVMRVNDTEVGKYNPVKARERKMLKELEDSGILDTVNPNVRIHCSSESNDVSEHSFENYRKNVQRVMKKHIDKLGIWMSGHPDIKYKGLLVFDETECCFEGIIKHAYGDQFDYIWDHNKPLVLHAPWNDADFVQQAYESDLDFLVWFCPYKPCGAVPRNANVVFPYVVIMDVRYERSVPYVIYDASKLVL